MTATTNNRLTRLPEGIEGAEAPRPGSAGVGWIDSEDGWPIVGLTFRTEYEGSQEWGIGKLRERVTGTNPRNFQMADDAAQHFALCDDQNAFAISVEPMNSMTFRWGDELGGPFRSSSAYAAHWAEYLPYTQGHQDASYVRFQASMQELRAMAMSMGVSPLPRSKAALREVIAAHPDSWRDSARPGLWPVSFARGEVLVIRADNGPAAEVVAALRDAIRSGTFAIGDGSGPFCSGLFLHNGAAVGPKTRAAITAAHDWHDERMAEAEPVLAELRADGFGFYFFGNPRTGGWKTVHGQEDDAVRYFLNGHTMRLPSGRRAQPFGWFSLQEMRDRVFVDRAEAYLDEREARAPGS